MTQVGPASNEAQSGFRGHWLEERERHSKMLVLGLAWPLSNIKAMDEDRLANIGRIALAIELPVAQQHVEPIHTAR